MSEHSELYDVCVIGGGPAGSTAATFIAMAGHDVLLVEKESFPIYKIGESLLPTTIHGICAMLGVTQELESQNFVHKKGGTFRWGKNKEPWTFAFAESSKFQGPTSYAYQVERIKFDTILLDNARKKGVEIREQHRVQDLFFENDKVAGVKLLDSDGTEHLIRSTYVVDASGHATTIARHAGERIQSKYFQNIALFGYFKNGGRMPQPNSGNIFCAAFDKGWFWYIPLSDTLTSVGAVIGKEHASLLHKEHSAVLSELIASCEPIQNLLSKATPCTDAPYDEIRVRKDYSYSHSSFWRPGLVLVGDAACFIDPVFSSGVHLATYSALLAARSINTSLEKRLNNEVLFKEFEARYRREYKYFYEFLTAFYNVEQDQKSYYWTAREVMNSEENGNLAFLNLIGGDAGGELRNLHLRSNKIRELLSEKLFPAATGVSNDMYVESGKQSAERGQFWAELNSEGFQLQLRGVLKDSSFTERPIFEDGLIPSTDGLHWVVPSPRSTTSRNFIEKF